MKKLKKLLAAIIVAALATTGLTGVVNAELDYVWLEAEDGDITGYVTNDTAGTSGGKGALLERLGGETSGQIEWEFEIPENGMYDIKILTSAGNVTHLSKYKWSLDGSDPAYNNNNAIGDTVYTAGMLQTSQPVTWYPITTAELDAGTHTMTISCNETRTGWSDHTSHFFDCVAIVPSDWSWTPDGIEKPEAPVVSDEEATDGYFWLEAENFTIPAGSTFAKYSSSDASGGYYFGANGSNVEPYVTETFYVEEAGEYDLNILGIANGGHLSKGKWAIDDGEFATCTEAVGVNVFSINSVITSYTNQNLGWFKMGTVSLDEGSHTLTIKTGPRSMDSNVLYAFDVVSLTPADWSWIPDGIEKPEAPVVDDDDEEQEGPTEWIDLEAEDGTVAQGGAYITTASAGDTYIFMNGAALEQKSTMTFEVVDNTYDIWALVGIDDGGDGNGYDRDYPRLCKYNFSWGTEETPFASVNSLKNVVEEWNPLYTTLYLNGTIANAMHWVKVAEDVELSGENTLVAEIVNPGTNNRNGAIDKVRIVPSSWNHVPTDTTTAPEEPTGPIIPENPDEPADWYDLEAEDGVNTSGNTHTVSGNTYVWVENPADAAQSSTVSFNAKAGTYDVWALVGLHNTPNSYPVFGWYDFYLNDADSKFGRKASNNLDIEWIDGGLYETRVFVSHAATQMHWVKVGDAIAIEAGENTIKAELVKAVHQCCAIDKIRVVPTSWNHIPTDITTAPEEPILPDEVSVTGVTLDDATLTMTAGETHTLTYEVTPAEATDKSVSWSSTDSSVARVSNEGVVTAVSAGEATITVTTNEGEFTDTCVVIVSANAGEDTSSGLIWLEAENAIIEGTGYTLRNDSNASGGKVFETQKTNDDPITLTMLFEIDEPGEYNVKVLSSEAWQMHLTKYKIQIDNEEAKTLPATQNPVVYNHYLVVSLPTRWHDVATMEFDEGTHMVTITLDAIRTLPGATEMLAFIDAVGIAPSDWEWDVSTIAKPQAPVDIEEINIEETSIEMRGGETYELSYDFAPANASARDMVWTTSNSNVATVENGVVTANAGGTAIITAKAKGNDAVYDTCEVTVLAKEVTSALIKIVDVTNTNQPGVAKTNGIVQVGTTQEEGTVYTFDVPFVAPKPGTYDIYYTGGPNGVMHASSAKYKVDGVDKGFVAESAFYASKGYANKADSTLAVNWQKFEKLTLDAEEHTISFIFDKKRSIDDSYMFAIEYLLLVPTGTELSLAKTGDTAAAENLAEVLLSGIFIDETETVEDLLLHKTALDGSTITWTSSNSSVIDENGNVTRPTYYGEDATVTLTASVSTTKVGFSYTGTKSFTIKVPKCDEYTVEDFKVEYADGKKFGEDGSGTLTASAVVKKNVTDDASAVLVLVRYDANGAMIDVNYEAVALTNELAPIQTSISVAGEANGETVEAFLWTDMAAKKLIDKNILTFTK